MAPPPSTPTNTPSKTGETKASSSTAHDKLPNHLILKTNRMPVKDSQAIERHPNVLKWAQSIRGGARGSVMKPKSEERLRARRNQYEDSNEVTFICKFMAALKKEDRKRRNAEKQKWTRVEWDQDGLKEAWNQSFLENSIPQIDTSDKAAKQILDSHPCIKNPKPTIDWALCPTVFDDDERLMEMNRLYYAQAGICPTDLWQPFCLLEAKMKGSLEDAIHECACGGAALVSAARQLHYVAGQDLTTPGADLTTPVFSLAVIPTVISLLVHWAEVDDKGITTYHTSHVCTYALENPGVLIQLRHDLDNILDWGTLNRKAEVIRLMTAIADGHENKRLRELPTPDVTEPGHDDEDEDEDEQDSEDEDVFEYALEQGLIGPESPTHRSKRRRVLHDETGDN